MTGGVQSPANPQFELKVNRPLRCAISVRRAPDANAPLDGLCIYVCQGVPGLSLVL